MRTGLKAMVYKMINLGLDYGRGAITQLSGMECYQTWINRGESARKTIAEIGPSMSRIRKYLTQINDQHIANAILPI
jgi:hypothetical protein